MEALQKSVDDLKTLLEKMSTTVSALEPLVPSVASLVALPTSVDSLQQTMKEAGDHLKSVSVAVKRIETGDRSSGSSGPQHTTEDDGILGPKPQFTYPQPPPPYPRPPPVQQRFGGPHLDTMEDDPSFLKPKMVFPSYDGTSDPLPWLNRCDLYFRGHNTPEHKKVWMASLHMTDAAQIWYYRLETAQGEPDWRRFCLLLNRRFGPPITESPLSELALLRRTGSVEEYAKQFVSIACREVELSERQQAQLFIAGLNNPLRTDVAIQSPMTLDDAIRYARAYEQRLALESVPQRQSGRAPFHSAGQQGSPTSGTQGSQTAAGVYAGPVAGSTPGVARPPGASRTSALPRRQLTTAEMAQRRAEGLCYNCPEKFFAGHRCKQLAVIEIVPDGVEEDEPAEQTDAAELGFLYMLSPVGRVEDEQPPRISLYALTGIHSREVPAMRVWVFLGNRRLTALLDSGSSKNFINTRVAEELGIPLYPDGAINVTGQWGSRPQPRALGGGAWQSWWRLLLV